MGSKIHKQITNDQQISSKTDDLANTNIESRSKFSCWNVIEPAWIDADQKDRRIYVHGEILEWIVAYIDENLLHENLRATVEEVHHHNLYGPVYLINFYILNQDERYFGSNILLKLDEDLDAIKDRLRYSMPWKTKPTYFLRVDSWFQYRKDQIMSQISKLKLQKYFRTSSLEVNWLYLPKIEIYEFFKFLPKERIEEINSIFRKMSKSRAEIYISDQFLWHREVCNYVEVDKVSLDMCVEEWRRHDLLKDFSIDNILSLDLANKDYRDPYMNEYLDRYLDILLKKSLPQLSSNHDKIEVPTDRFQSYIRNYFVSRFYDNISSLSFENRRFVDDLYKYDIPITKMNHETVVLKEDCPPSEELIKKFCNGTITYVISNYTHFSNSLFRMLLNKPNNSQSYKIAFDQEFNFKYESNKKFVSTITKIVNWTSDYKKIKIELKDCTERNAGKLAKFVEYLIILFKEIKILEVEVSLCFINCRLEDYSFLKNIDNVINDIQFTKMNIPPSQIKVLSCELTQQNIVNFFNCSEITDNDVMTLLENINFNQIWIEGSNSCTPAIYFLMAEHLMDKEDVDTIEANRFNHNMWYTRYNFYYHFDKIEFFKDSNKIVARNRHTKEIVDLYISMIKKDIIFRPFSTHKKTEF